MTTSDLGQVSYCPYHEGPICSPCGLTTCDLHLPSAPFCCGLIAFKAATANARSEELDWKKLGELLGYEPKQVELMAKQAYEILRQLAVQDQVPAQWSLLRNAKCCVVCNREATIFDQGWGWCSDDCYRWLPPAAVEAEARWGTWFRRLLAQWRNLNLKTIERLTGLNRETVRWLLWQHLGWQDESFDEFSQRGEPLVRNPRIPKVTEILKRVEAADKWGVE